VMMQAVTGNYHDVLNVHARIGRTLNADDRDPVAVISDAYWRRRFGGGVNVLGRPVQLQGRPGTIVGGEPPGFFGTQPGRMVDITTTLTLQAAAMPPKARWLYLIGRLAPGKSLMQAREALQARWTQIVAADTSLARSPLTLELDPGAQGLNELR